LLQKETLYVRNGISISQRVCKVFGKRVKTCYCYTPFAPLVLGFWCNSCSIHLPPRWDLLCVDINANYTPFDSPSYRNCIPAPAECQTRIQRWFRCWKCI